MSVLQKDQPMIDEKFQLGKIRLKEMSSKTLKKKISIYQNVSQIISLDFKELSYECFQEWTKNPSGLIDKNVAFN